MMNEQEFSELMCRNYESLDQSKVKPAVAMLKEKLGEIIPELRERIAENPTNWLIGRPDIECACKEDNGGIPLSKCFMCKGVGRCREWSLHHGWGTGIRNLLRKEGFGEEYFGIDNLDDYYAKLVEEATK